MESNRDNLPPSPDHDEAETTRGRQLLSFRAGDLLCERFRVVRFIARGGMGELYEAEDVALGERVALKTIRPEIASDERVHQRFRREVQLARRVTHSSICRIFDLFQHLPAAASRAGSPPAVFVTMELLHGETLADRLKREGRLTPEQALPIIRQMAAALSAAHAVGIVHRDFKSNNVMLLPAERTVDPPRVVVTDFGLAFALGEANVVAAASITVAGELLGTPDYMAPEQIEGGAVTRATDIYALGVVLYEMVTGERPFAADTPLASALRRLSGPPARSPREVVPGLPATWERVIMRCLARYPDHRFSEATDVVQALEPGGPGARWWESRSAIAAFGAVALLLAVVGVFGWRGWNDRARTGAEAPSSAVNGATTDTMRPAVAVLGFRNLAGREDAQWLSTALAEMLTTELGASDALRTIPGENVNRMKMELSLADADSYAADTLGRIRQNLGTDLVVFGSYVTVGQGNDSELRVDIRLQDSRQGQTISLVSDTGKSSEILDLVSRVGTRLRERLGVDAGPDAMASIRASQPSSSDATRLYAEGLMRLRRFDSLGARELLDRAVQIDPKFTLAHSALASTWAALGYDDRARESAQRALALSAGLPRTDRMQVEGTSYELAGAWAKAIPIWRSLVSSFPDDIEHTLRLANAQIASGAAKEGLTTIEGFRKRFPSVKDPRLELAEAAGLDTLSDFKRVQTAAAAASAAGEAQGARLLVANAKLREGGAILRLGQEDKAVALFEEARSIYEQAGDRAGLARSLNSLASAISDGPDPKRSMELYEQGLAIARAIGTQDLVARFLNNMAILERRSGNLRGSLSMNQEALKIRRETGDKTTAAVSLNNIGNVLLDLGDPQAATAHYEESAAMSREMGDRRGQARALHNAAEGMILQGELARARVANEEALRIRRTIDDPASLAVSLFGVGHTAVVQGDLATAKKSLNEALEMDRRADRPRPIAFSLYFLAEVALVEGDLTRARALHQEALDIRTKVGEKFTAAQSRAAIAVLALEEGRAGDAEMLAREAAAVFETQTTPDEAAARATIALAMLAQGRQTPAQREIERARTLVRTPRYVTARMAVAIAAARVESATNPAAALRALEGVRSEAAARGIPRSEFEARRARAAIEGRRSPAEGAKLLEALRKDAKARGFGLYAR